MKKQLISAILAATLCLTMVPTVAYAADTSGAKTVTAKDGSQWTVDGDNYTCNTRLGWPNYSFYPLGDSSNGQIVTLSADVTIARKDEESTNLGGNLAFLVGAVDLNNNGVMNETGDNNTGDYYYLIHAGTSDNEPNVGIERNNRTWSGWAQTVNMPYKEGDVVHFTVTFNPKTMNFLVYADGKLLIDYTDPDPLPGAASGQYGLASRATNGKFENVDVAVGKTPDWIGNNTSGKVKLTEDLYESIVIPAGKTVTLDLNGHRVTETVVNYGNLTLTDSTGQGHIEVRKGYLNGAETKVYAVNNFGKLTVDGATIICYSTGGNTEAYGIYNRDGATLSVKSGLVQATTEKDRTAYGIWNRGTIEEISGGRIVSEMIYRVNQQDNAAVWNDGANALIKKISGGELFARTNGVGTERFAAGIRNSSGAVIEEISDGYIFAEAFGAGETVAYGILNRDNSTIQKISGGTIEAYCTSKKWAFAIRHQDNARIGEITGGLFHAYKDLTNNNCVCIAGFNNSSIGSISGGVFYADTTGTGMFALRCNDSSSVESLSGGAFYVGSGSGHVTDNSKKISYASGYSLQAAGESGARIVAKNGSSIKEEITVDGYKATVDGKTYDLYVNSEKASVGGKVYDNANAAVEAAGNGDTVKLLGNSFSAITIPAGKNITLDLNGTDRRGTVTNNGTVKLIDSTKADWATSGTGRILIKSDAGGGVYCVVNNGTLTIDGAFIHIYGTGDSTDAIAVMNNKSGSLTVKSGRIHSTTMKRWFGNAIKSSGGTIEEIAGGELISEITHPNDDGNAVNLKNVCINLVDGATVKLISGGSIWARSNNISNDQQYSTAIRLQGGSVIEKIAGGSVRAFALKRADDKRVSFGILVENGRIGEISGGFIAGYSSAENFCFGIKVDTNGRIDKVSGGYIYSEMANGSGANSIAIANWGKVGEISGGVLHAVNYRKDAGGAWPIRTTDAGHTAYFSGGTFITNKNIGEIHAFYATGGGVNTIREGYYLTGVNKGVAYVKPVDESQTIVYALGSSVTYGSNNRGRSFADMLDVADNGITVVKSTISGTTLVDNGSGSYVARLQKDFAGMPAPDHLIVQLSTNDAGQNKPLGTLKDDQWDNFDTQTIIGAIEFIISYAKEKWGCDVSFYTNPVFSSDNYKAMVNAMPAIRAKWGIGVVDFYNYGCGIEQPAKLSVLMEDNSVHPNESGYRWIAKVYESYLTGVSVNDEHHHIECTYKKGNEDQRGRCKVCGAYAVDYLKAYAQTRPNGDNKDVRVLIEANENLLKQYKSAEFEMIFTYKDGKTETKSTGEKVTTAFKTVKAAGEQVPAAGHSGFFGAFVTNVPVGEDGVTAVSVKITFRLADGTTQIVEFGPVSLIQ